MMKKTLLLLVALLLASPGVMAEEQAVVCPKKPAKAKRARKVAGKLFSEAETEFMSNSFERALALFLCSLRVVEHENTMINIRESVDRLEDKEAALVHLNGYLEEYPDSESAGEIEKIVAEIEESMEKTTPEDEPPLKQMPVFEDVYKRDVEEQEPEPEDDEEGSKRALTAAGWTLLGTAAASLIAGGVLQGLSVSAEDDAMNAGSYDEFLDEKDKKESFQTGAIVGFSVGGALLGTGVILLVVASGQEDDSEVALSPAPGGFLIRGRF